MPASRESPTGGARRRRGQSAVGRGAEYIPLHRGNGRGDPDRVLPPTPALHFLAFLAALAAGFTLVALVPERLPTPLLVQDETSHPGRFIAERAKSTLISLTSMGARVSGSRESEELAANLIRGEIERVAAAAQPAHSIQVDVQRPSGAFPLSFLDGMTHVYRGVQNVVVRIASAQGSNHSVLMNCHFDTVPDSPGAADDASSCAIMLEIFRVITQSTQTLRHNVVLLFNGAEENFLQASHGFITQHKWAKEIRVVVNLESCGAGGREIMFQSGPNHPWLMELYAKNVEYPFGSSIAQEIFQSGFFPGDTDFRIFRDFGGVPGLDFTWYLNGYVYHTEHDNAAKVPSGTLQRTGDNMLALIRALVDADELSNMAKHEDGKTVFFDVLGSFVIFWSLVAGDFINVVALILSGYSIMSNLREATERGLSRRAFVLQLAACTGTVLLSWFASFASSTCVALTLTALGTTMSWFARPLWIAFLYAVPTLTVSMSILLWRSRKQRQIVVSPWTLFQLYYDASQIVWTLMLLLGAVFRLQSTFIPLFWVIFPSVGNLVRLKIFKHWRDSKWIVLHGGMLILPFIQCSYMFQFGLQILIPIMGRSGAAHNSELIVSLMSTAILNLLFSFIVPMVLLIRHPGRVITLFVAVFVAALTVLVTTPLGFPFSADPSNFAPQKFAILHARRSFHDIRGELVKRETGFWLIDLNMNSPDTVRGIVPEVSRARSTEEDCKQYLFCGMPYYLPIRSFVWKTHWIDDADVTIPLDTSLRLLSRKSLPGPGSVKRYAFSLSGPDHMGVMLSPASGVTLLRWSVSDEPPLAGPQWNGRDTYFMYFAYAGSATEWNFTLDYEVSENWKEPVFDIAIGSHFLHGPSQRSQQLSNLISKFPPWTTVTGWQATYQSFIF